MPKMVRNERTAGRMWFTGRSIKLLERILIPYLIWLSECDMK